MASRKSKSKARSGLFPVFEIREGEYVFVDTPSGFCKVIWMHHVSPDDVLSQSVYVLLLEGQSHPFCFFSDRLLLVSDVPNP